MQRFLFPSVAITNIYSRIRLIFISSKIPLRYAFEDGAAADEAQVMQFKMYERITASAANGRKKKQPGRKPKSALRAN